MVVVHEGAGVAQPMIARNYSMPGIERASLPSIFPAVMAGNLND